MIADDEYQRYKQSVDFIRRYIFPGGLLPCINVLNACANRANFKLRAYSDMTSSYVKTLLEWQRRFNNKSESLMELGYDEYFQKRMFSSIIKKESNMYDRSLVDYLGVNNKMLQQLEAERIKDDVRRSESDLWEY